MTKGRLLAAAATLALSGLAASLPSAQNAVPPSIIEAFPRPKLVVRAGHAGIVSEVAVNGGGALLASVGGDSSVRVWDARTGAVVRILSGHSEQLGVVRFVHNDEWIFAAGGMKASIWDVASGRLIKTLHGSRASIDSNGQLMATAVGRRLQVLDVDTGKIAHDLVIRDGPVLLEVLTMAFAPDGVLATGMSDGTVILWDAKHGTRLDTLSLHDKGVFELTISSDGQLLVAGGNDKYVTIYDLRAHQVLKRLDLARSPSAVSVNDAYIAVADRDLTLHLWNRSTIQARPDLRNNGSMWGVTLAPSGPLAYICVSSEIQGWDIVASMRVSTFKGDADTYAAVKFPVAKPIVLGAATLSGVRFWDLLRGLPVRSLPGDAWAFHPSGLVVASSLVNAVRLRGSFAAGTPRNISTSSAASIAFSPNGELIAIAGATTNAIVVQRVKDDAVLKRWTEADSIRRIDFDPSGTKLAIALDKNLILRDVTTGASRFELGEIPALFPEIAFNQNDPIIAVGTAQGEVTTIDFRTSPPDAVELSAAGTEPRVTAITWSSDGQFVATGHQGNDVSVWSVKDHGKIATLTGHTGSVRAITFDPSGAWMATGSDDGTVRLWQVGTWREAAALVTFGGFHARENAYRAALRRAKPGTTDAQIRQFAETLSRLTALGANAELAKYGFDGLELDEPEWLVVSPEGFFDGTPEAMAAVSWTSEAETLIEPLETFFNDYYRPGLLGEILNGHPPRAEFDLATITRVPGLRRMLTDRSAWLARVERGTVVCFSEPPTSVVSPELVRGARPRPAAVDQFRFVPTDASCKYQLLLPGTHSYDEWQAVLPARSTPSTLALPSTKPHGMLRVLTVANEHFAPRSKLPDLAGSAAGASDLRQYFETAAVSLTSSNLFRGVDLRPAVYDATGAQIEDAVASLARDADADDTVVIFFSGHGIVPADSEMFYFVTSDTVGISRAELTKTSVSTAALAYSLRRIPAKRVLIVLDTCQSGAVVEALARIGAMRLRQEFDRAALTSKPVDEDGGIVVISATTPLQVAVQSPAGSSLVTALLQVLRKKGGGELLASQLASELSALVPEISSALYVAHRPDVAASGMDFVVGVR